MSPPHLHTLMAAALALVYPLLALVAVQAADPPPPGTSNHIHLKSLVEQCAFKLGNMGFDLCPVISGNEGGWRVETMRKTDPTVTKTVYSIDLKAPLEKQDGVPGHEQCPPGTWICGTISNRRPRHEDEGWRVQEVTPVAGTMKLSNVTEYRPGVNITAQYTPWRADKNIRALHVRLHGGYHAYGQQMADFQFICDTNVEEPSVPTFAWTWNGTHTFNWHTKHACPKWVEASPSKGKDEDKDKDSSTPPEDNAPPPPDEDREDDPAPPPGSSPDELFEDGRLDRQSARRTMVLILSSATALVVLVYLAWRPPTRVRRAVSRFVKKHPRLARWRVGESVLVRWAYEDLELRDGEDEGEEDVMVNFNALADVDEGIPLKPSPRKGRWASYGTT
ncbi:autophagy-related protein 27-domain-containing protein [Epithele typhae]|uniref:autophagy-related protein 27-domain-containing protein n=1 Tax=Epithele typhae TaxID=378194 RepID=UPI00200886D6|nr:autophagy-related protein 27-domain-containing protein [Epithele typhae]KAH9919485.1 autophagy-related protein 27-domain-containing protein [Epithele typhae]